MARRPASAGRSARLLDEPRYLEQILGLAAEGIVVVDLRGAISVYSHRMAEITGYAREEAQRPGFPGLLFPPGEQREQSVARFRAALFGHDIREEEWQITRQDGTARVVLTSTTRFAFGNRRLMMATLVDITARKEAEQRASRYRDRLRHLSAELVMAEERERERECIALEIHDGLGENLALVKIKLRQLESAGRSDLAGALGEVAGLVQESITQARDLTFELSPPVLHQIGLPPALEWLAEKTTAVAQVQVTARDDGKPKDLDAASRALLYRSARELLHNVVKHSGASRARIETRRVGATVELQISDNGVGFDTSAREQPADGFGLFSIQERLKEWNGLFELRSVRDEGTHVTIQLPLAGAGDS